MLLRHPGHNNNNNNISVNDQVEPSNNYYYHQLINKIIVDLNKIHLNYWNNDHKNNTTFLDYIQRTRRTDVYEQYKASIRKATAVIVENHFKISDDIEIDENVIGEIYAYLTDELNKTLNSSLTPTNELLSSLNNNDTCGTTTVESLLMFYAKEANVMGDGKLSERYYIEVVNNIFMFLLFFFQ